MVIECVFIGEYIDIEDVGIYKCVVCSMLLFEFGVKFYLGCGWFSYFKLFNGEVIDEKIDYLYGMVCVEVCCNYCGVYLGYVFEDGLCDKIGLWYCINLVVLNFEF